MTEPRAVIDIVVAKALTDEFLEEVSLFVRALCRSKARNATTCISTKVGKPLGCEIQSFVPCRFAEMGLPIGGVDVQTLRRRVIPPDQRLGQTVWMMDVVEAKAPFDAKTIFIRRTFDAIDIFDLAVLHLERQLAPNTAIRTDAFDFFVEVRAITGLRVIQNVGGHERARRTGLNAFTAGHATGRAHGIVLIEDDFGLPAPEGHADHVVDLNFAASANAEIALDAGVQIDPHGDVAVIQKRYRLGFDPRKAAFTDPGQRLHVVEVAGGIVIGLSLIRDQKLHHHLARFLGPFRCRLDDHAVARRAHTGRDKRPLAFDFDHAGPAVSIRAIARRGLMAEMRDFQALPVGRFPNRRAFGDGNVLAIKLERDGGDLTSVHQISSPKCFITRRIGFGAA